MLSQDIYHEHSVSLRHGFLGYFTTEAATISKALGCESQGGVTTDAIVVGPFLR